MKHSPVLRVFAACISVAALCLTSLPLRAQPETGAPTVAVLYFQDLGPSPEAKPLRKALAQMLITDLSRIEGLKVLQRERIERFVAETAIGESGLATAQTAVLAGRALEADYVVQGTFSATSEQVTVEVRVSSREATAAELSRTFSRPMEEFLRLEQEIVKAIVEAVGVEPVLRVAPSPQEGVVSPAVAVMDFENLSTSGELDPLQAPLSDMFCATLSQIPEVTLVKRARIKEVIEELGLAATGLVDPQTAAKLGRLLGAQRILVSSFVEMGGILRFDSHLIDTESGQLVAALVVSGSKDEYAGWVEELARQVAAALRVPMPSAEQGAKVEAPTESWEAYRYLERAIYYRSVERPQKALEEVLRCLYLEPYCEKALRWALLITDDLDRVDLTVELAERIIGRYSLDPDKRRLVGTAYAMMYWNYANTGQYERALEVIERALHADISETMKMSLLLRKARHLRWPGKASPGVILRIYRQVLASPAADAPERFWAGEAAARLLMQQNRMDEAISVILEAAATPGEPDRGGWGSFQKEILDKLLAYSLEKDDLMTARKLVEASIRKFPRTAGATGWVHLSRARLCEAEGKLDEAIQSYQQLAELRYWDSFFDAMWQLGDLYVRKGDVQQALQAYQRIMRSAGASRYQNERQLAAQAAERLKELGMPVPALPPGGYQPSSILTQEFGHATLILADHGYLLASLSALPVDNPSEALCPYQTVVMEWPKGGQPWWITQAWLNFVQRGGGLFLSMPMYVRASAARPLRASLGVGPVDGPRPGGRVHLTAIGNHPAAQALEGLRVGLRAQIPLECEKRIVLATWNDHPALASVEYGLGRALVAGFGLVSIGREFGARVPQDYIDCDLEPPTEDSLLPLFGWLRQEEAEGKRAQLLVHFRAVTDSWARKDYSQAIELLQAICAGHAGTEYEELALYTIGDILQNSLKSYDQARGHFEQVYTKFPDGELALPARMAAADCAQATGADDAGLLNLYAEVVERGADTEIGATAQLKIGFIHLVADRLEDATTAFRKVVNDFPAGYAKNNALYALGYCYEKTGRPADAQRIYRSILDMLQRPEPSDPVDPQCFPTAWKLLLKGTKYAAHSTGREWRGNVVVVEGRVYPGYGLQTLAQWRLDQLNSEAGTGADSNEE